MLFRFKQTAGQLFDSGGLIATRLVIDSKFEWHALSIKAGNQSGMASWSMRSRSALNSQPISEIQAMRYIQMSSTMTAPTLP